MIENGVRFVYNFYYRKSKNKRNGNMTQKLSIGRKIVNLMARNDVEQYECYEIRNGIQKLIVSRKIGSD